MKTFSVPEISCGHCKSSIEGEVSKVDGVDSVVVDIDTKVANVTGTASDELIVAAIDEAGYDVASVS